MVCVHTLQYHLIILEQLEEGDEIEYGILEGEENGK